MILQIRGILSNPLAWEVLKRALNTQISIENLNKQMGYLVPSTIKPEAIPLNIKVILIGDYYTYNILYNYDDDFRKLFKVMVDFDTEMNRDSENVYKIAQFIATHNRRENLKHLDKSAVARVIEYSSRLAGDQHRLSARFNRIIEILYEADLWAEEDDSAIIGEKHIQKPLAKKYIETINMRKNSRRCFRGQFIDRSGRKKVGQINGLAVISAGEYSFGNLPELRPLSTGESGL